MVVTVEPGIYFSVYALQHFYLPSPVHSKYINIDVLQRYLPVGGVRIEDDILITSKRYENLTTAPKGDAMLDIIRRGKTCGTSAPDSRPALSLRKRSNEVEPPLVRAPGLPNNVSQPIQRPLARAATMPAEVKQKEDVDFEPFAGPSLFSNFTRSMTTEEKIQQWRQKREPVTATPLATVKQLHQVCGEPTLGVQHVYLSDASSLASLPRSTPQSEHLSTCKNCLILVQTLDRLRQTLITSAQSSPKQEAIPVHETSVRVETPVEARIRDQAKELQADESARTLRLERELPIRDSLAPRVGPSETATRFSTGYTPAQGPHPVPARNPFSPSPPHVQPASGTDDTTPKYMGRRVSTRTNERRNPAGLPTSSPLVPVSESRGSLEKYESLRLRLEELEESARNRAPRQEQPAHSYRPPMSRPSMPNLMSHNPWQQQDVQSPRQDDLAPPSQYPFQQYNVKSRVSGVNRTPAALTSRRSVNLEALMVDDERVDRREREQRPERVGHEALRRGRYFTR
jgi:Xaa-Pro dipeptidase